MADTITDINNFAANRPSFVVTNMVRPCDELMLGKGVVGQKRGNLLVL